MLSIAVSVVCAAIAVVGAIVVGIVDRCRRDSSMVVQVLGWHRLWIWSCGTAAIDIQREDQEDDTAKQDADADEDDCDCGCGRGGRKLRCVVARLQHLLTQAKAHQRSP